QIKQTHMQLRRLRLLLVGNYVNLQRAIFLIWAYQKIAIKTAGIVLQGFPPPVIVDARPGGYGPAIIELPVERAHGTWAAAAQMLGSHLDGLGLHHLAGIQERFEVFGLSEI